jgi:hypothetical protein
MIQHRYQIWRLFTPFLYAGRLQTGQLLPHLFFMQHHCSNYERKPYDTGGGGGSADFLWMIMLSMLFLTLVAGLLGSKFPIQNTNQTILYVVLFVWSKRMTDTFTIFGFNVVPTYLPMIRIAYDLLGILSAGGNIMSPLFGVVFGYIYVWSVVEAPNVLRTRIVVTPKPIIDLLSWCTQVTVIVGPQSTNNSPIHTPIATAKSLVPVNNSTSATTAVGIVLGISAPSTPPPAPKSMLSSLLNSKSIPAVQGLVVDGTTVSHSKRGWVHKQTKWTKLWKRRYLVLEQRTLRISDNDTNQGKVLAGFPKPALKAVVSCAVKHNPHVMRVTTQEGDILLQCETAEECVAWMAAIKTLIP